MLSVSGCRGIVGRSMTPEVAARFAAALASYLTVRRTATATAPHAHDESSTRGARTPTTTRAPEVVLARDGRAGGDILAMAAAAGLAGAGCNVTDFGIATSPTAAVLTDARGADAAIIITASHNPQEWNGLKVILRDPAAPPGRPDACAPPKSIADEIIRRFHAAPTSTTSAAPGAVRREPGAEGSSLLHGTVADRTHVQLVQEALAELVITDDRASMAIRCIVDSVNASGRLGAKLLLGRRLIHHIGDGATGIFPHPPEPVRENLDLLCRFVRDKEADVGFAQDPDADRLALVDEYGRYIGEEYTLALATESLLMRRHEGTKARRHEGVVVTNLSTSRMIDDIAARHGARVIRTPVGEANVVEAMKASGAVFGGEGNGGVVWPRVSYIRDSLSAMGLVIGLMAATGKRLSQLVADIPAYSIVKRKLDLPAKDAAARAIEAIARAFSRGGGEGAGGRIDRQDGVRVDFDSRRAWLHVRASNTEPIMRLIAEAPTEAEATALLDEAARVIA
jgi:phosphomannomutase